MENFNFNGKVIIEFYEDNCFNCQMMQPILKELEVLFPDIRFYRVNTDIHRDLVNYYHITSLPTLVLLHNGQQLAKIVGSKSLSVLQREINKILNYA